MPVPFYTATDHLGKEAGGESKNREIGTTERRDEREREGEGEVDKGKCK